MVSKLVPTLCLALVVALAAPPRSTAHPLPEHFFFQPPINLGAAINSSANESSPALSADGLTIVFSSNRLGTFGDNDLWISTRTSLVDPWIPPVNLGVNINSSDRESGAELSADGLRLQFYSDRPGGFGGRDLWQSTRASSASPWSVASNLGATINTASEDQNSSFSSNELTLLFDSNRAGGQGTTDIWQATRSSTAVPWSGITNLGAVINSTATENSPNLSADGLTLMFTRNTRELWISRRESVASPWPTPDLMEGPVNSPFVADTAVLRPDNRTLIFRSNSRPGGFGGEDLWQSEAEPAVYYTRFSSAAVGARSGNVSGIEIGFNSTVTAGNPDGPNSQFGVRDEFGHTFRMQTLDGRMTTDPINLSSYEDVSASIDVRLSTTSWEADDSLRVELTNGAATILLALATGAQLDVLEGGWNNFRAIVPADWITAQFIVTSSTDSTTGAEVIDIDNIAFFGTRIIPEPSTWALLLAASGCVVIWMLRHCIRSFCTSGPTMV